MVAGADSIDDMDLLRHGGMRRLFDDIRAPSTFGTFLRSFTFGRAVGCLASRLHARAITGTLRAQLINIPARLARSARRLVLHLPQHSPWQDAFEQMLTAATGPPAPCP